MEEQLRVESYEQIRIRRKRLESNERRIDELKRLFIKIYEDNASGKRVQHIHIKYDGLGFIPLDELMKKETAWPKSRRTP